MSSVTDVERIRERLSITEVVEKRVALQKSGKDYKALCPFHDDRNPSMIVTPGLGRYKCWACGAGGDIFTFVMEYHKVEFPEALRMLAEEANIELTGAKAKPGEIGQRKTRLEAMKFAQAFFVEQFSKTPAAQKYCGGRGLTPEVCELWGIGFAPDFGDLLATKLKRAGFQLADCKELFLVDSDASGAYYDRFRGRLMFPIRDEQGNVIAFGGRILGAGQPKYINSGDTPLFHKRKVLYGLDVARTHVQKSQKLVLVEGYLDVIACHQAGIRQAVASLGTSLSEDHARLIKRYAPTEVVILYDSDEAGLKAASRAIEVLGEVGISTQIVALPPGEDPDTLLQRAGPEAVRTAVENRLSPMEFALRQLQRRLGPQDPEFLSEAIRILAEAPRDVDIERHLPMLVEMLPGRSDPLATAQALKRDIYRIRRRPKGKSSEHQRAITRQRKSPIVNSYERTLLLALLNPVLCEISYKFLRDNEIILSPQTREICDVVISENIKFSNGLSPDRWLPQLPANLQDLFGDLYSKAVISVKESDVEAAGIWLNHRREQVDMKAKIPAEATDESLTEYTNFLAKSKNKNSD